MMPGNVLSSELEYAIYIPPGDIVTDILTSYSLGGIALFDSHLGLEVQVWTATLLNDGSPDATIMIQAETVPPAVLYAEDGITQISLTFDQNMFPFIAYVANGVAKYRWFDATLPGYRVVTIASGVTTPYASLDDKRAFMSVLNMNDIILAYIRDDNLYMRMQRDRYGVEYILASDLSAHIIAPILMEVSMNERFRLQFKLGGVLYN